MKLVRHTNGWFWIGETIKARDMFALMTQTDVISTRLLLLLIATKTKACTRYIVTVRCCNLQACSN